MAEEKRVKLGVDVGELSNQLVQINNLIEQNYQKSLQGQSEYNKILEESIDLLHKQVDLVNQLGQQNQINPSLNSSQSRVIGGGNNDDISKLNDLVEEILTDINNIWEKFSSITTPIPVKIDNSSNLNNQQNNNIGGGSNTGGGNNNSNTGNNVNNQQNNQVNNNVTNTLRAGSSLVAGSASDPNYLIAGLAGMIPVVGAGAASVLSKMIGEAERRVRAEAIFQGATGGNMPFISLQGLGYRNAEAYQKIAQYYPANINLDYTDFQFEKGFNVGGGTMNSLLRAMREDFNLKGGFSSSELGVTYLSRLVESGNIDSKKVRGYTEDYLKILIDLNQKQLETTGETNSVLSGEVVAGIAKTSEKFGDPTILQRVVEGIRGGLTQAPSPQAEALQYWAMSQVNPEASIWEMQLMRENPFSAESRGYFSNYLNALLQTGNANDVRFNVMNAFGLTAHQTEELLNGIDKAKQEQGENFNLIDYLEGANFSSIDVGAKIRGEASRATAENEVLLAQAADRLADIGEPILKFTNKAIEKTGEVVDMLVKYFGDTSIKDSIKDALDEFYSEHPNAKNLGASEYTETPEEKEKSMKGAYRQNSINPNTNSSMNWSF